MAVLVGPQSAGSSGELVMQIENYARRVHEDAVSDWRALERNVRRAVDDMRSIARSEDYTPVGRQKALAVAREKARDLLKPQTTTVERLRSRIADLETAALPPRPKRTAADLPELLIEQEIRARFRGVDPLTILPIYLDAVQNGDDQLARALEDAPTAFPLLTTEHRALGREQMLQRSEKWEDLSALREELVVQQAILQAAEGDLVRAGTDPHVAGTEPR